MRPVSDLKRRVAPFEVVTDMVPAGDQPRAIAEMEQRLRARAKETVLLGATGTGKTATGAWLAERPRWHMHFVPTYSSWLNQVERFFAIITNRAIRRGSFGSVKELTDRIDRFVKAYNTSCRPFIWTASADSILEKLARLCGRINGAGH